MKNLIYTVTSEKYSEIFDLTISNMEKYAKATESDLEIILCTEPRSDIDNQEDKSTFLIENKYKERKIFDNYENIMYLDCDILIKESSTNIFEENINQFAAHIGGCTSYNEYISRTVSEIFPEFDMNCRINAGMFIVKRDSLRNIFSKTKSLSKKVNSNGYIINDEICLSEVLRLECFNFTRLDHKWNSSFETMDDSSFFVHCMAKTIYQKLEKLRSII